MSSRSGTRPRRARPSSGIRSSGAPPISRGCKRVFRSSSRTSRRRPGSIRFATGSPNETSFPSSTCPCSATASLTGVLWFNSSNSRVWRENEISVLVDVAGQLAVVLASARAREQRIRAERDLRSRDAILRAVSRSAERFLVQRSFDEGIVELMRVLGEATGVTSAHVFENVRSDGPSTHTRRLAGWESGRGNSTVDDPRLAHVQPAPHFPRWAEVLGRGDVVSSHISDLPARGARRARSRRLALRSRRADLRPRSLVGLHRLRGRRAPSRLEPRRDRRASSRRRNRRRRDHP